MCMSLQEQQWPQLQIINIVYSSRCDMGCRQRPCPLSWVTSTTMITAKTAYGKIASHVMTPLLIN